MRFEMALALVARAEERAAWIGDDHGEPYEQALLTRTVPLEMHVALKEILDHLRSALDYCAHEVCEIAAGTPTSGQIYFPITAAGFAAADFRSRVGKLMPGLLQTRPDLVSMMARFQPFAAPANQWLADLATLANRTKHVDLTVNHVEVADLTFRKDVASGVTFMDVRRTDGTQIAVSGLAAIEAPNGFEGPGCKLIYLHLAPIGTDLLGFLRPALAGVRHIILSIDSSL